MPILPAEPDCNPADLWDEGRHVPNDKTAVWWCLHTKPRQEKATARELRTEGIAYYLPQVWKESRTPQGRRIRSVVPLFPSYLFLHGDEHDRLIAYVLGLSHALNIAFFTVLAESGEAAPKLARMSSTTFDAQLEVASRVAQDSPELYYEIQSLNDYGAESLEALAQAVERVRTSVLAQDHDGFVALMRRGRDYLQDRRSVAERRA